MQWTDERVATLQKLWQEGLSAGEIAKQLDITRNAVIGKAHRLNLQSRPSPIRRNNNVQAIDTRPAKEIYKTAKIIALSGHACQWPVGDPRDPSFEFCGKNAMPAKPYCRDHAAQAYQNFNADHFDSKRQRNLRLASQRNSGGLKVVK